MEKWSAVPRIVLGAVFTAAIISVCAAEDVSVPSLAELAAQNRQLQEQVRRQQKMIEELGAKLSEIQKSGEHTQDQLKELRDHPADAPAPVVESGDRGHEVRISGEAGLAFFSTGPSGQFPNSEFRVDDAKLFLEAPVMRDIYFFTELDLFARETSNTNLQFGELYADFENISGHLGWEDRLLNVRVGRINIPFGEEYLTRGPMENPLISHSLADFWGVDNGIELYGSGGAWNYVVAVQNGGVNMTRDYNADKAVVARVGWSPLKWLHFGASVMRTGDLTVGTTAKPGDNASGIWFANDFFEALGAPATTTKFHANLWEGDVTARWSGGHVSAALGGARFDDNDTAADNSRNLLYGYLETVQSITEDLYGAVRFSRIDVPGGYPLIGWGDYSLYSNPALTRELNRLSMGFGYHLGPPVVLKLEYAFEWGRQVGGASRDKEDFLGGEVGVKF